MISAMAVGHSAAIPVIATFLNSGSNALTAFIDLFESASEEYREYSPLEVEIAKKLRKYLVECETARLERATRIHRSSDKDADNILMSDRALRPGDSAFCFQHSATTGRLVAVPRLLCFI